MLDDGEPAFGVQWANGFETAARRLGLAIAGRASWDPRRREYRRLARRVARSGADAVFLGGLIDTNGARVVRDLRRALGRGRADLLAPDGFTPVPLLTEQAGAAARDVRVSVAGLVPGRLPPAGAAFARRFASTQAGVPVQASAVAAAQSAIVLLDAIGRSDGTRAAVVEELFRTRIEDGLLGPLRFDAGGDAVAAPVTVLRVRGGGASRVVGSVEGATVERIVRPPVRLLDR